MLPYFLTEKIYGNTLVCLAFVVSFLYEVSHHKAIGYFNLQ